MSNHPSFTECAVVACGSLIPELNRLKEEGFLDAVKLIYTAPGLHQRPIELERQLAECIRRAKESAKRVLVVYGGKYCYVNVKAPERSIDDVIAECVEEGYSITRTEAFNCVDMVVAESEQEKMADAKKCWFCTPGWMKYRTKMFEGWDRAVANENFPKYSGGAVMLDAVGYFDEISLEAPEEILDFSDWMGIPLEPQPVSLDRLKSVLAAALERSGEAPGI
jgi:hypothetical protein